MLDRHCDSLLQFTRTQAHTRYSPLLLHHQLPLITLTPPPKSGKPKGVVHSTGGYMVYTFTTTKYVFAMNQGDVYWCTADCGWITGHS
jgi:acetyl-CoA synthetase